MRTAKLLGGAVSPGELVPLFGSNVGPAALAQPTVSSAGAVDVIAGGTRVLFDGVRAEIHPYDVTVEGPRPEVYDCKWGARGIGADVLHQLDDARRNAAGEDVPLAVAIVAFDARRSCEIRLARATAPHEATTLIALEEIQGLAEPLV